VSRVWVAGWPIAGNYALYVRDGVVMQLCCLLETEYKMGPQRIWSSVTWWVPSNCVVSANRTHLQFCRRLTQHISGPRRFLVLCISTVIDSPPSYKCATFLWVGASPVLASYKLKAGKRVVTSCFATGSVLNVATLKSFVVTRLRQCIEETAFVVPSLCISRSLTGILPRHYNSFCPKRCSHFALDLPLLSGSSYWEPTC